MSKTITNKKEALAEVSRLLSAPTFSRESASRASGLLALAEMLDKGDVQIPKAPHVRFDERIRQYNKEQRDLTVAATGQYLVPAAFEKNYFKALRKYDSLFDPAFNWQVDTETGQKLRIPLLDDTQNAASQVSEGSQSVTDNNPVTGVIDFGICPTWRSGLIYVSIELLQDSGIPMEDALAAAFAIRFGRGVGPVFVETLLNGATLGATAEGYNTITHADLLALYQSLDPAYRESGKFLMTSDTLITLAGIVDEVNRPIFPKILDNKTLWGNQIGICPSMPEIAGNSTPIVFYVPRFFAVRHTKPYFTMVIAAETKAEYGQVGFQAFMRTDSDLAIPANGPSPAVFLQMASSS